MNRLTFKDIIISGTILLLMYSFVLTCVWVAGGFQ